MAATAPSSLPSPPAAALDLRGLAELLLLGAIWGGSFLLMRVAVPAFGALPLVELRLLAGTVVLLPFAVVAWRRLRPLLGRLALVGLLNSAVPFVLFACAAAHAPAAVGAIANSLTALFAVLVAWLMFGERIGVRRGIGLVCGLAGVVVLVAGRDAGLGSAWAALAGTTAALCYAVAANLVRRWLGGLPPTATAAATLAFSTVLLAPLALAQWPVVPPPPLAWLCALGLGVLCTGLAYALYFRLLARVGPARAATVTYLVPLFGVAWAWALLDEPLTPAMALAGLLILGGVALNQLRPAARGPG